MTAYLALAVNAIHAQTVTRCVSSLAGDRLTWKTPLYFATALPADLPVLTVNETVRFQTIDGFGASFMEAGMICLNSLPTNQQGNLLEALFNPETGAGFSVMKTPVAATDFMCAGPFYSYNDVPDDVAMTHFSIARDLGTNGVIPFIEIARQHGSFMLQAPMDYPPDWMLFDLNSNRDVNPAYFDALASYYLHYLQAYERRGIHIDCLSLFNEPGIYTQISYPSIRDLLKQHVGPLLRQAGVTTHIMPCEASHRYKALQDYPTILDDPAARQYVDVLPYHGYDFSNFESIAALGTNYPGLPLWMTEVCYAVTIGSPLPLPRYDFEDGDFWGDQIISDLEVGASAWIYWNMILDQNGGPWLVAPEHGDPDGNVQHPVVIVNRDTHAITYTGCYYYLAHFSKFIRPGSVRVQVTGNAWEVRCVAFQLPDHPLVAQLINRRNTTNAVVLAFGGKYLSLELPARSITTARWWPEELSAKLLRIGNEWGAVAIEWPTNCAHCELQASTNLQPGANWSEFTATRTLTNEHYRIVLTPTDAPRFFRLASP